MWYSKIVRRDRIRNPREEINMITFMAGYFTCAATAGLIYGFAKFMDWRARK